MRAILVAAILAVITASCALAQGEVQNVYAPLQATPWVVERVEHDSDYDVVVREAGKVSALQCQIQELRSKWCQASRRSSYDPVARAKANKLSRQIVSLQSQLNLVQRSVDDERFARQSADNVLSGRISNEAVTRRQGDEDNRLLIVGVALILVAGLAGVAFIATR
jgi:uncharacterized protein involved in exopolysaccharide biosynthesis